MRRPALQSQTLSSHAQRWFARTQIAMAASTTHVRRRTGFLSARSVSGAYLISQDHCGKMETTSAHRRELAAYPIVSEANSIRSRRCKAIGKNLA